MYLSRDFWRPDEERLQDQTTLPPLTSGSGGGATGAGVGSAGVPVNDVGTGQPAALRSFFALNKDQGAQVLGGLANSLNQRIATTQAGLSTVPGYGPEMPTIDFSTNSPGGQKAIDDLNAQIAAYNEVQRTRAGSAKDISGRNQAAAQALGPDVGRLGTAEGQQSLLEQRYGSGNYTPGQARLDAWLSGSAANTRPDLVGGVQQAYAGLGQAAAPPGQLPLPIAAQQFADEQRKQLYRSMRQRFGLGG